MCLRVGVLRLEAGWKELEVLAREYGSPEKLHAPGFFHQEWAALGSSIEVEEAHLPPFRKRIQVQRGGGTWNLMESLTLLGLGDRTTGGRTDTRLQILCMMVVQGFAQLAAGSR